MKRRAPVFFDLVADRSMQPRAELLRYIKEGFNRLYSQGSREETHVRWEGPDMRGEFHRVPTIL